MNQKEAKQALRETNRILKAATEATSWRDVERELQTAQTEAVAAVGLTGLLGAALTEATGKNSEAPTKLMEAAKTELEARNEIRQRE